MKQGDKERLRIADVNFKKFHKWLHETFKGGSIFERVYATQVADGYELNMVWQYGSLKNSTYVTKIPFYDMFDPCFDPDIFYKEVK